MQGSHFGWHAPQSRAGGKALGLDIRLRGLPVSPHQTSLGRIHAPATGASAGCPPLARPTRCPLSALPRRKGSSSQLCSTAGRGRSQIQVTRLAIAGLGPQPTLLATLLPSNTSWGPGPRSVATWDSSLELGPGVFPPQGATGFPHPGLRIVTITSEAATGLFLFL